MSLHIYNNEIKESVKDVEMLFDTLSLKDTGLNRFLISKIDGGKFLDKNSFIDRFGFKLYLSELSTGCKAAICVEQFKDKIISLKECGLNARDLIIAKCNCGSVVFYEEDITFSTEYNDIDVIFNNRHFSSMDRLNTFIKGDDDCDDLIIKE